METKEILTYTLKKKSEYVYQIKSGRKVLARFTSSSEGFHDGCKYFRDLERAVKYWIEMRYQGLAMFGADVSNIEIQVVS